MFTLFRAQVTRQELVKDGVIAAFLQVVYIAFVAVFFMIADTAFPDDSWLVVVGVVAFLILLVLSVAVSGMLLFGYPMYYALQKKYPEALAILLVTCGTLLAIFAFLVLGALLGAIIS
jgi:Ni,Fe-hydrogenase I cytochrome b subunit